MKNILSKISLILFFICSASVFSQVNFYSGYQFIYDDNIYNNTLQEEDFINSFSLGAAYNIESEINNIQFYYEGIFSDFQKQKIRSFSANKIGIVETHLFGDSENPLNAGVNYSFRLNRDEFKLYDFNQLSAYINYRQSIEEKHFLIAGYNFFFTKMILKTLLFFPTQNTKPF